MGKLVYGMSASLDGYVNDADGNFGWTAQDPGMHRFVNDLQSRVGAYLFGRRVYEAMRVWEDPAALAAMPEHVLEYVPIWRAADKRVFSTTLKDPAMPRTTVERRLDLDSVRALKESTASELSVAGPTLAAHLLRAGLVDELTVFIDPVVVGGGTRFLPDGLALDLTLLEEQRFSAGAVFLRYAIRN
ncbi:MAG TPA: dihydrofolate reductase family protein [Propionicimonas sp.]|jgi:dihydrofolate reductase|uniref:dihydrofolate reductase family protein n=1 Tax=Propionicimonas sp. TaxID=1955623 RepID=UPI002F425E78